MKKISIILGAMCITKSVYCQKPQKLVEWGAFLLEEGGEPLFPKENAPSRSRPTEADINSLTLSPESRLEAYQAYLQNELGVAVAPNKAFAEEAFHLHKKQMQMSVWPPRLPLSISKLNTQERVLAVFVLKSFDRISYLEKIDLWWFTGKTPLRSYWSREINDPYRIATASNALTRIALHMKRSQQAPAVAPTNSGCRIFMDKKLPYSDIASVEAAARSISVSRVGALAPAGVSGQGMYWSVPLGPQDCQALMKRVSSENSHLMVSPENQGFKIIKKAL